MATVYILYSQKINQYYIGSCLDLEKRLSEHLSATMDVAYTKKINQYYIGSCLDLEKRLAEHLSAKMDVAYTKRSDDWDVYFKIDNLTYEMARKIETHIKQMKSRKYIENLVRFPEISQKLIDNYGAGSSR
jgi:putative endonuclease